MCKTAWTVYKCCFFIINSCIWICHQITEKTSLSDQRIIRFFHIPIKYQLSLVPTCFQGLSVIETQDEQSAARGLRIIMFNGFTRKIHYNPDWRLSCSMLLT
ncbi:hypothetical protein ILYODFUR_028660 [Ilyodon furcidens]|uniref:Secreted protein n=1 Tax=Ilyodon furcidens TaxID=33524 RepID=A0ABV0UJS5_9TELE